MSNQMVLNARAVLQQAGTLINVHDKLIRERGGHFNIFSILGMERLEVQTHSAFIFELLNPKGSHEQGCAYLKVFLEEALNIDEFDYTTVRVEREKSVSDLGRIDLVIENKDMIIAIEMKIDAGDQVQQLVRYDKYCKSRGKAHKLVYLTLFGDDADEFSTQTDEGICDLYYERLSFKSDIHNWLTACINTGSTPLLPVLRESIYQYALLVEKLTGRLEGGKLMDLKTLLLKDDNLKAALELQKALPYAKAEVEYHFWECFHDKFLNELDKFGMLFYADKCFCEDKQAEVEVIISCRSRQTYEYGVKYHLYTKDDYSVKLFVKQALYDKMYISVGFTNEDTFIPYIEWTSWMKALGQRSGLSSTGKNTKYSYVKTGISIRDESLCQLQDEKYLDSASECLVNEAVEVVKKIKSFLDERDNR